MLYSQYESNMNVVVVGRRVTFVVVFGSALQQLRIFHLLSLMLS